MKFNYNKLRGRIREVFSTQAAFAEAMNIADNSLSMKLNNKLDFTQQEIEKAVDLLQIPKEELSAYFFTLEVQGIEQGMVIGI